MEILIGQPVVHFMDSTMTNSRQLPVDNYDKSFLIDFFVFTKEFSIKRRLAIKRDPNLNRIGIVKKQT